MCCIGYCLFESQKKIIRTLILSWNVFLKRSLTGPYRLLQRSTFCLSDKWKRNLFVAVNQLLFLKNCVNVKCLNGKCRYMNMQWLYHPWSWDVIKIVLHWGYFSWNFKMCMVLVLVMKLTVQNTNCDWFRSPYII